MGVLLTAIAGPTAKLAGAGGSGTTTWLGLAKDYADTAAAIFALLAVAIALISLFGQRRHNKLSVVPLPDIRYRDMEDKIRIELMNNGNGPLVCIALEVLKNGAVVSDSLIDAMPSEINDWAFFIGNADGRSLRAGDSVILLEREFSNGVREARVQKMLRSALGDLTVAIVYTDIYKSRAKRYEKSLAWFKRML